MPSVPRLNPHAHTRERARAQQGKKTVELAPKDASPDRPTLERWGDQKDRFFSRYSPILDAAACKIDMRPGDALFLPTGVWHRVTSTPGSVAISLGVTANDISVEHLRQEQVLPS